jgi:hypothetical protein
MQLMSIDEFKAELQSLVSKRVAFKRNAANSLIIYFDGGPGDSEVRSFFIDPTWRFEQNGRIVVGSFDFQIEGSDFGSKEEYESEWHRRCELMERLVGSELLRVEIEDSSADLTLEFSDRQIIRSFANSAFDEDSWTYRNLPKRIKATVSPLGIRIEELQEKPARAKHDT